MNSWEEYRLFIIKEFERVNEQIKQLAISREADAEKSRDDLKETVALSERRICNKLEKLEDNLTTNYNKLESDVDINKLSINTLQVKAGGWGVVGGAGITLLIKLIEFISTLLGG